MTRIHTPRGRGMRAALVALALGLVSVAAYAAGDAAPSIGVVNVNTATPAELERLPGIGEAKARAILEAREKRGGFERVEDLLEVRGIGEAALERLRPHVTVRGRTTAPPTDR